MMRVAVIILVLTALAEMTGGCRQFAAKPQWFDPSERDQLIQQRDRLERELNEQKQQNAELRQSLADLRGFEDDKLSVLVYPVEIRFGRYTLPYDADKDGIDDGVNVYLEMKDARGDIIKAGGEVTIELWDLAAPPGHGKLWQWDYSADQLGDYWRGGVLADHFKFSIPWPQGHLPEHNHLTLKLRFVCALTGRSFEIQQLITAAIHHEPSSLP